VRFKLRSSTYQAFWDLHAWAGVVTSLLAYVMFFFGAWTLFYTELLAWQETRGPAPSMAEVDRVLDAGFERGDIARKKLRLFFPGPRSSQFSVNYTDGEGATRYAFVGADGLVEPRSGAADFFYGLHYLQPPSAPRWLYVVAGAVAGLLVLVVVSGVLIHLRRLLPELHQFRPKKALQVIWSDAHKVLGTLGIPFVTVFAFTGAWMGLDSVVAPALVKRVFHGDESAAAVAQFGPRLPRLEPANEPSSRRSLAELLAAAHEQPPPPGVARKDVEFCRSVYLNDVGDREATAELYCGPVSVLLRQRDASVVSAPHAPPLLTRVSEVPYAMHFVEFAHLPLRVLYVLLTLAGCGAILTGNWLWLARRVPHRGTWLLQRATLATAAGSLVASGALLVVNRLAISASLERQAFWWSWLAVGAASFALTRAGALWVGALRLSAGLFAVTPALSVARAGFSGWLSAPSSVRGMDVTLLALGALFLWAAEAVRRWQPHKSRSAGKEEQADVARASG
jgi:uncharacterized iron-regulated membrane protein